MITFPFRIILSALRCGQVQERRGDCACPRSAYNLLQRTFQRILTVLSRTSLICMAIRGESFVRGTNRTYQLLAGHLSEIGLVDWIGDFALFACKLVTTGIAAMAVYFVADNDAHVLYPAVAAIVVGESC